MTNYSELSDDELLRLASGNKKPKVDYSSLDDEQLAKMAGGSIDTTPTAQNADNSLPAQQNNPNDLSNLDNIMNNQEPSLWDRTGRYLQGGVKFVQDNTNNAVNAINNANIPQGLSNLGGAALEGAINIPQGLLQFGNQFVNDTGSTVSNVVNNPASVLDIPEAFAKGMYNGAYNLAQGAVDIPAALSSAWNGTEFQRQYTLPRAGEILDAAFKKALVDTGIKTLEEYNKNQQELNKILMEKNTRLNQLPIAQTLGEFSLPLGALKALGIGGKASQLAKVGSASQKASIASDIAKSAAVGSGFGALTPGSLQDKVTGAGTGAVIGGAMGGAIRTAPYVSNAIKFTGKVGKALGKEAINRANPKIIIRL